MAKLTFKNFERTGPHRAFQPKGCDIKRSRKNVGMITEDFKLFSETDQPYRIWLIVEDSSQKLGWKNIKLKKGFATIDQAKNWVRQNDSAIQNQFNLFEI